MKQNSINQKSSIARRLFGGLLGLLLSAVLCLSIGFSTNNATDAGLADEAARAVIKNEKFAQFREMMPAEADNLDDFVLKQGQVEANAKKIADCDDIPGVKATLEEEIITARKLRYSPGTATGSANLVDPLDLWNLATLQRKIPKSVAAKLIGKSFDTFDDFREAFWKAMADSDYVKGFNKGNITLMKNGHAPFAKEVEQYKGLDKLILHHINPIEKGGGVYDLDNIVIVTPVEHNLIHYGGNCK